MERAILFNIQRFSLHDGDGIRTTFFFKGCPLSCMWCHNPEGQAYEPQLMYFADRCRNCSNCAGMASSEGRDVAGLLHADGCDTTGLLHTQLCIYGAREVSGRAYTPEELIHIAEKDTAFYQSSGGGVTLSGGEVLAQPRAFLRSFAGGLKGKGLHVAIDTCGHVPFEAFENVMPYVDVFLYDIKLFDSARHRQFTGHDNELILSNLKKLSDTGAKIEIRIPIIEGVNNDDTEMDRIIKFLTQNARPQKVWLLPYHAMGTDKYQRIGMIAEGEFSTPSSQRMQELAEKFSVNNLPVVKS